MLHLTAKDAEDAEHHKTRRNIVEPCKQIFRCVPCALCGEP
jgi:hypothetical protein